MPHLSSFLLLAILPALSLADYTIYTSGSSALAAGWQDWSYGSTIAYDVTTPSAVAGGISVNASAWSGFSPYSNAAFSNSFASLSFEIATSTINQVQIYFNDVAGNSSASFNLGSLSGAGGVSTSAWTTLTLDLSSLASDNWDRVTFQGLASGAVFYLNNIALTGTGSGGGGSSGGATSDVSIIVDGALALSAGFEDWSWGDTLTYASTAIPGGKGVEVVLAAYSGLSVFAETAFGNKYAGLSFDIATSDPSQIQLYLNDAAGSSSTQIILSLFDGAENISLNGYTTIVVNFNDLPPSGSALPSDATWTRINWMSLSKGATFYLDNVKLLASITIPPVFLSAEPLGNNLIAVTTQGAADPSTLKVSLNGNNIKVTNITTYSPVGSPSASISYLTLASSLAPGTVIITNGTTTFKTVLPALQYGAITTAARVQVPISPLIYGINFPSDASLIQDLGITLSRWGGNAMTAYNFEGDYTNAGNDWYFENRYAGANADQWVGWVNEAGSDTILLVPALDWVAKDNTSYSYSKKIYPDQSGFDPFLSDAGSGLFPNGSYIEPAPAQATAYKPWNTSLAQTWLKGLTNKPTFFTVDNEIEIASNTHQDMHPDPIGYDEELHRVINTILAVKSVLPNATSMAPSTCAWWFYWTSEIGYTDNAAHDNIDFLPWFLTQMKAAETTYGKRLLDYLDIHAYFQATTNDTAAGRAVRLRMTRGLWDPSYIDESWVGTDTNPPWSEPNPNALWLIPRMKQLIQIHYPGTKLSFGEWNTGDDNDITGGLAAADALGIFGVYGLDAATYWSTISSFDSSSPVGLAYWLFNGYGTHFGATGVQVSLSQPLPTSSNVLGVYAALDQNNKLAVVIINKDPVNPISIYISNIPTGKYFVRHFGGDAGVAKWQTEVLLTETNYITVPYYTAVMFKQL